MDEKKRIDIFTQLLTPGEALVALRFSRDIHAGDKTASNMLAPGSKRPFPLPTVVVLGRKLVHMSDVLRLIEGNRAQAENDPVAVEASPPALAPSKGRRRKGG